MRPAQPHDQVMDAPGRISACRLRCPRWAGAMPRAGFHVAAVQEPSLLDDLRALSQDRVSVSPAEQIILNLRATSALCTLIHLASEHDPRRMPRAGAPRRGRNRGIHPQQFRELSAVCARSRPAPESATIICAIFSRRLPWPQPRAISHEVRMERATTLLDPFAAAPEADRHDVRVSR